MRFGLPASDYFDGLAHPETPGEDWSLMTLLYERIIHAFFDVAPDDGVESS